MAKTKSTKRALLMSGLALLMSISMLVGSTFAWFTDSVSSAGNIIQSGTLDVAMEWADGTKAVPDAESSEWTDASTGAIFNYDLWEPGYTKVVHVKIANEGTLALKYQLNIAANGTVSELANVIDVYYADPAIQVENREALAGATKLGTLSQILNQLNTTASGKLLAGEKDIVTLALKMQESAGNEYQNLAIGSDFSVELFATQLTYEKDSFDNQYDKDAVIAATAEEAQAALDNAVPGTTIYLTPGVNYGTLYMRPSANTDVTREVDWVGNNYRYETYSRFENLTIAGAKGATIDAIQIEGGVYYNTEHSQADTYPIMLSLIELRNVVIDGVTFTGKGGYDPQGHGNVINLSEQNIKVDGLTLKNCVLNSEDNNARLIYRTGRTDHVHTYTYGGETYEFVPDMKDITVTGCTFNGGYMGLELRETENVTITNNIFNVSDRNILLPVNSGCTYSGTITITGNTSYYAKERFVRMSGAGDANVVIKDNTLIGYMSADADYIKVTDANGTPVIENNVLAPVSVSSADELKTALENGVKDIALTSNVNADFGIALAEGTTLDGNGFSINYTGETYQLVKFANGSVVKDVTFNNYRGKAPATANSTFTLEEVTINFNYGNCTALDISGTGSGTAVLKNVVCNGTTDETHLNPATPSQADYSPYGDVLLGGSWALDATDCTFGSLHGWNTGNGSSVSLTNVTYKVFRMHYWNNRTLYINGVETAWSNSNAVPVAHDVGGCWSVQPAFR